MILATLPLKSTHIFEIGRMITYESWATLGLLATSRKSQFATVWQVLATLFWLQVTFSNVSEIDPWSVLNLILLETPQTFTYFHLLDGFDVLVFVLVCVFVLV